MNGSRKDHGLSYNSLVLQIWAATQSGNLEVAYTHDEDHVCSYLNVLIKKLYLCAVTD